MSETMLLAAEADAIRARSAQWLAMVSSRDTDGITEFYEDDGAFLVPNAPMAVGREAVHAMWARLLGAPGLSLVWTSGAVDVARGGDMAFEMGSYRLRMDGPTGPIMDDGKYVVVWKRRGETWRVAADIFNTDQAAGS